jgi:predicted glutamine amidotransferase
MCRLTAYLGEPLEVGTIVFRGSHSLYEQSYLPRELISGSVNADGYGVVWYNGLEPVRLGASRPIWQETDLKGVLEANTSSMVLAAVRNATPGIPVEGGGLPMTYGPWSFILNGYVEDFRASYMRTLRSRLPDDLYGELRGSSDTETLFLLAVAALQEGGDVGDALEHVRQIVEEGLTSGHVAQLTMILADGESLAALRGASVEKTNSLYLAVGHPDAPRGTLLASEPLDDDGTWTPVTPHEVMRLSL